MSQIDHHLTSGLPRPSLRPAQRTEATSRAHPRRSPLDHVLAGGFLAALAIYLVGFWNLLQLRNPGPEPTSVEVAMWGGLLAFDAVMTVMLFFGLAFRATNRRRDPAPGRDN